MPPCAARRNRFSRGEAGRPTGLTEVECGQKCFDMVAVSDLRHVSLSASLYIFDEIGYLPHSTSVFFIAPNKGNEKSTFSPGEGMATFGGK